MENHKIKTIYKKILITITTFIILFNVVRFKLNNDFFLARDLNFSVETQNKTFWNNINKERVLKTGATKFDNDGNKYFSIDLNDEYYAGYTYYRISIYSKNNINFSIDFTIDRKNFKIVNDDFYNLNDKKSGLSKEQQKELMDLAIQKFKDFQEEYYKVNK